MSEINISLLAENQNLSKFEITENFTCIRFIEQNKERFELEFNLEKGTSFNTFLIRNYKELFIEVDINIFSLILIFICYPR